jgi:hypothetical protein
MGVALSIPTRQDISLAKSPHLEDYPWLIHFRIFHSRRFLGCGGVRYRAKGSVYVKLIAGMSSKSVESLERGKVSPWQSAIGITLPSTKHGPSKIMAHTSLRLSFPQPHLRFDGIPTHSTSQNSLLPFFFPVLLFCRNRATSGQCPRERP